MVQAFVIGQPVNRKIRVLILLTQFYVTGLAGQSQSTYREIDRIKSRCFKAGYTWITYYSNWVETYSSIHLSDLTSISLSKWVKLL